MRIREATIHNFKSISQDCTLNVDTKVTPLVGASETGKTNILEALSKFFTSEAFDESDVCTFSEEPISDDSLMVSVKFRLGDSDKEPLSRINERLAELNEFTLSKQKNGQYVVAELKLEKSSPKEPQPPGRLTELHDIIRQNLEQTDAQLAAFYQTLPEQHNEHIVTRQALDAWIEHMPLSGFPVLPSEAEEKDFLMRAQNLADNFSSQIQQIPDMPTELQQISTVLRDTIQEANSLSYEVHVEQETEVNKLLELCPRIVYMKDADIRLLPDSVPISQLEAGTDEALSYQPLLRIAGISIADLREPDATRRERRLRTAATRIDKFLKLWTQEKLDARFVVDQDTLYFHLTGKEGHYGKLSDRSEGLRWFLSFCLSYGLMSDCSHYSVLLLDEPGLHLHAAAQKDLLDQFESVAKSSQIIYTTHSPFMINKNYPERIRTILKEEHPRGTIIDNKPYRATKGGSYEPIRTSIGITLGNSLFIGGYNLIVEGIADQIILAAFSRHLARQDKQPFINLQDICITPAGGADNIPYFAYLCNIEDMKTVVILDNDREGETAFSRIEVEGVFQTERVIRVRDAITKSKEKEAIVELEDLIDADFYHAAFLESYKELPKIEFLNKLPETYGEIAKQPMNPTNQEAEKKTEGGRETVRRRGESKGITSLYSDLFEKHKDQRWGHFDKVLVARQIGQKLDEDVSPGEKTILNFKTLFKTINSKFK